MSTPNTPQTPSTFRKVIEEKTKSNKSVDQAVKTNDQLTDTNYALSEMQTGVEMVSETIETSTDRVISKLDDLQAGVELTIDSVESLSDINSSIQNQTNFTIALNDNVKKLSSVLKETFSPIAGPDVKPFELPETTETNIVENLPEVKKEEPEISLEPLILKEDSQEEPNKDKTISDSDLTLDSIKKLIQAGFKESHSAVDRISGMLFKYTVSAALWAAKWAALILGLVMTADLIIIHFKYWGQLFKDNFKMFSEKLGPLEPILTDIFKNFEEVKKYFLSGDYANLTVAIVKGVASVAMTIVHGLEYALGKLGASILRALGKDDWADKLEATVIERYSESTGYMPSREEIELVGKVRGSEKYKSYSADNEMSTYGAGSAKQRDSFSMSKEEVERRLQTHRETQAKLKDKTITEESTIKDSTKEFELKAEVRHLKEKAETYSDNKKELAKIANRLNELKESPDAPDSVKDETAMVIKDVDLKTPAVRPIEPKDTQEAKHIETIKNIDTSQSSTVNNQNITSMNQNINTHKTVVQQQPVTNYDAPGMYRAQEVS